MSVDTLPPMVFPHTADTRATDPITSHEARDSITVEGLAESQQEVLAILHIYAPATAAEIVEYHEIRFASEQTGWSLSDSRLRTALSELAKAGRVEEFDTVRRASRPGGRETSQRRWVVA